MIKIKYSEKLQNSIDKLYEVFDDSDEYYGIKNYRENQITKDELSALENKKIRELEYEDMKNFVNSSLLTVGSPIDFKHYLPRILELYFFDSDASSSWHGFHICTNINTLRDPKINESDSDWEYPEWTEDQEKATEDFFKNLYWFTKDNYYSKDLPALTLEGTIEFVRMLKLKFEEKIVEDLFDKDKWDSEMYQSAANVFVD